MKIRLPSTASEHQIQSAFFQWWNLTHRIPLAWAIPNGGLRHPNVARKLKAEGVRPGVPDVFIAVPVPPYAGLFLEFKSKRGTVTDDQKAMHGYLKQSGYAVAVVRNLDEAIATTENYLLPMQNQFSARH